MLRATEQLTWQATLVKFGRGCENTKNIAGEPRRDDVSWQHFSGKHLKCKVLFTQPSEKTWASSHGGREENKSLALIRQPSDDRQLRIIVECGSAEMNEDDNPNQNGQSSTANASTSRSTSSQPQPPIILHDVDLVCINQAYVHTDRRLDAVELMHRNLTVGIRYLHEHDETKSYRMQLTFTNETDKKFFLSLVEPDALIRASATAPLEGKSVRQCHDTDSKEASGGDFKAKKQATSDQRPAKRERAERIGDPTRTNAVPGEDDKKLAEETPPTSQGLAEQLLQMAASRMLQSCFVPPSIHSAVPIPGAVLASQSQSPPSKGCANCAHMCQPLYPAQEGGNGFPCPRQEEQAQTESPLTDPMTCEPDDLEYNEGMHGWPHPSAVECIQDDVRRLCLMDPDLDSVIARCVDEYLQESRPAYVEYY